MKVKAAVVFETAAHPFTETQPLKMRKSTSIRPVRVKFWSK